MAARAQGFVLPAPPPTSSHRSWAVAVDTAAPAPQDLIEPPDQAYLGTDRLRLGARSIVVLEGALGG
jgi:hypothetical protein